MISNKDFKDFLIPKYSRLSGSSVNSLLSNKSNLSDDEDDHINPHHN